MLELNQIDITISGLLEHYRNGDFTPKQLVDALLDTYKSSDNPVWIRTLAPESLSPYLQNLEGKTPEDLPLYGIPFAIKDNIDLAGIPTTAACEAFAYTPERSAFVVQQLLQAGAIPMGKTNLDQFATGLVGVRSPWGACRNVFNPEYISGGSSSGSAVAVAKGWVSFSLGTDTAGSGRVPAMLNNLIGLKPSKGVLSTRGVVPACRSLDCVSIFAFTADDANMVFDIAAQFDELDPFARPNPYSNGKRYYGQPQGRLKVGVPRAEQLEFFGDKAAQVIFYESLKRVEQCGGELVEVDIEPFINAAKLLYQGPWVAERYVATQPLIDESPEALLPVINTIISSGKKPSAADTFRAQYQLQAYNQQAQAQLAKVDALVVPTAPTAYTINEVEQDPIALNSNMGYYTNFMNLLDCAGIAITTGFLPQGPGFGITLLHKAFSDKRLLGFAARLQRAVGLPLGATQQTVPAQPVDERVAKTFVDVVACGAHLEGLPLNWQLTERGAHRVETTQTAPRYRFYALAGGPPKRPALIRDEIQGAAIAVEVWRVPAEHFGSFVAEIPAPLGIGKVELADGRWESGFICEASGIAGAEEITHLRDWRTYMRSLR
jgi:allophanate hydrolase